MQRIRLFQTSVLQGTDSDLLDTPVLTNKELCLGGRRLNVTQTGKSSVASPVEYEDQVLSLSTRNLEAMFFFLMKFSIVKLSCIHILS